MHTRQVIKGRQNMSSLYMPRGWSTRGIDTHASLGCNSTLYLLLADNAPAKVQIYGKYIDEVGTTHLWINDMYVGNVDLIDFEIDTAQIHGDNNFLKIDMAHENARYRKHQVRQTDFLLRDIYVEY